jgi:hypothetical protein
MYASLLFLYFPYTITPSLYTIQSINRYNTLQLQLQYAIT